MIYFRERLICDKEKSIEYFLMKSRWKNCVADGNINCIEIVKACLYQY